MWHRQDPGIRMDIDDGWRISNAREEALYDEFFPSDCDILPSMYPKISDIRRTKSQNLNDSHLV